MERGYNIGVLFADQANNGLTHDFFAGILDSFKRTVEKKGYNISFLNCCKEGENRKTYLEQAKSRGCDGIAIACIDYEDEEVTQLLCSDIPIVTIDEETGRTICVKSDNIQGIKKMVYYLGEMGHRRIAFITGDDNTVTKVRLNSFREACAQIGAQIPEEYIRQSAYRNIKKAVYQTEQLLRLGNPPSCIIYSDDYAAIGGMNVLRARGLEIPGDISVVGYDGLDILSQYEPRLTTVRQNTAQIGRIAGEKLMECIENPCRVAAETIIVETELEKGRTVGRVFY